MGPKLRVKQLWERGSGSSGSHLLGSSSLQRDHTWVIPFTQTCDNETAFSLKAGTKDYALSGEVPGETGTSELSLKKKYR